MGHSQQCGITQGSTHIYGVFFVLFLGGGVGGGGRIPSVCSFAESMSGPWELLCYSKIFVHGYGHWHDSKVWCLKTFKQGYAFVWFVVSFDASHW